MKMLLPANKSDLAVAKRERERERLQCFCQPTSLIAFAMSSTTQGEPKYDRISDRTFANGKPNFNFATPLTGGLASGLAL